MKLSLVIPAYNESSIIEATLRTVTARLADMDPDYELLLVDDGSTDNMADLVRPFADSHVRLTGYHPNGGKGKAVREGKLEAKAGQAGGGRRPVHRLPAAGQAGLPGLSPHPAADLQGLRRAGAALLRPAL